MGKIVGTCDKCFQPVPVENDAVEIESIVTGQPLMLLFFKARHFLPTESCQGSPSRAQYIEGQPRDKRGYEYNADLEGLFRTAHWLIGANARGEITDQIFNTAVEALRQRAKEKREINSLSGERE